MTKRSLGAMNPLIRKIQHIHPTLWEYYRSIISISLNPPGKNAGTHRKIICKIILEPEWNTGLNGNVSFSLLSMTNRFYGSLMSLENDWEKSYQALSGVLGMLALLGTFSLNSIFELFQCFQ